MEKNIREKFYYNKKLYQVHAIQRFSSYSNFYPKNFKVQHFFYFEDFKMFLMKDEKMTSKNPLIKIFCIS